MTQLSAKITADTSGFRKSIKDAENVLKGFTAEESAAAGALRKVYDVTQDQVKAYKKVSESMLRATDGTKTIRQQSNALRDDIERLKIQWNNLSETAKKSRFGQSMANSIRTAEAQLRAMQGTVQSTSAVTTAASSSMEGLVSVVGRFAPAVGAGTTALKVMKDAFFATEQNMDEWGRTCEAAKGTYQVFLDTINNGSWSDFFKNIGNAQKEMRNLFDLYDTLGSTRQNNQARIALQERKVNELRRRLTAGEDVKKELKEADNYLRTLKGQESTAAKTAGREGIVTALGADVPRNVREAVADGFIKGGQDFMNYAVKRVAELEKVTKKGESMTVTGPSGITQVVQKTPDQYAYSGSKTLEYEYKALKNLIDKESNEVLTKGLETYTQGVTLEAQIEQQSRKIESAVKQKIGAEAKRESLDLGFDLDKYVNSRMAVAPSSAGLPGNKEINRQMQSAIGSYQTDKSLEHIWDNVSKKDLANEAISQFGSLNSSMESVYNTLTNLSDIENPFQFFDSLVGVAQNVMNVTNMIDGLQKTMRSLGMVSKVTTAQEIADSAAKASASGTEAAADTVAATASTFKAHSAIPFVGAAIAGAMIAAMLVAISSSKNKVPKFANGGIISGPTLGLMGEYGGAVNNPEVVAPLDKLRGMLADNDTQSTGEVRFVIDGNTLSGVLKKVNRLSSRR